MKTSRAPATALVIQQLRSLARPQVRAGLGRFGIQGKNILGISVPALRALAKETGKNHHLAAGLWKSEIHEARILAAYVEEIDQVGEAQMERWARDFDSWDICDQVCGNLFVYTPWAEEKALEWAQRDEEFVKRAGFVLMAYLAVYQKKAPDAMFHRFFPLIEQEASDPRNFVRKAVNWALRQIGKRNSDLAGEAVRRAERILKQKAGPAHWVARDALRELRLRATKARS